MSEYTIFQMKPNAFGEIRYGVRNSHDVCVYTAWTEQEAEQAIERMIRTGSFDYERTAEQIDRAIDAFRRTLDLEAKLGYTRD